MSDRLIVQRPGSPPESIPLSGRITLGGGPGDEVAVPGAGANVLAAWPAPDGIVLEALGVRAEVAGRPVPPGVRRLLREGERAEALGLELAPEPRPEGTLALAGELLGLAGTGAPVRGPWLLVVEGPRAGERLPIADGLVLGRGAGAGLSLDDPATSRQHARLAHRDGCVRLLDLRSKNGVTVNGRRVGRKAMRLAPGDLVSLGSTALLYEASETSSRQALARNPARSCPGRAVRPTPAASSRLALVLLAAAALLGAGALLG